ncbi:MAG TPA: ATP synthase F1 subunit epsilon [Oligoflexia bacterium]|nr:ATP synthase F1 subunit epsilon [Oligoflexia bacterium]HMR24352.1 ATP synthase F1 subunit epsilon [Oligoflexia bacterium]
MAHEEAIALEIVTPAKSLVNTRCVKVSIPGHKGELEVLESHTELLSTLLTGLVQYQHAGQIHKVAVKAGFLQVNQNHIRLLADDAKFKKDVNVEQVQAELKEVEAKLVSEKVGIEEREGLYQERDWLQALLKL